jgi:hypothetical protein
MFGWKAWNPEFSRQAYAADASSDVASKTRLQQPILLWGSIQYWMKNVHFKFSFSSKHVINYSNCIQQQSKFSLILFIAQSYGFSLFIVFWIFLAPTV